MNGRTRPRSLRPVWRVTRPGEGAAGHARQRNRRRTWRVWPWTAWFSRAAPRRRRRAFHYNAAMADRLEERPGDAEDSPRTRTYASVLCRAGRRPAGPLGRGTLLRDALRPAPPCTPSTGLIVVAYIAWLVWDGVKRTQARAHDRELLPGQPQPALVGGGPLRDGDPAQRDHARGHDRAGLRGRDAVRPVLLRPAAGHDHPVADPGALLLPRAGLHRVRVPRAPLRRRRRAP